MSSKRLELFRRGDREFVTRVVRLSREFAIRLIKVSLKGTAVAVNGIRSPVDGWQGSCGLVSKIERGSRSDLVMEV